MPVKSLRLIDVVEEFKLLKPENYAPMREDGSGDVDVSWIPKVLKQYQPKLTQAGIELNGVLGAGTQGVAYSVSSGQVLKVTQDKSEAIAAAHVVNKSFKNVYKVFKVFEIGQSPRGQLFGILQEKLAPVPQTETLLRNLLEFDGGLTYPLNHNEYETPEDLEYVKEIITVTGQADGMSDQIPQVTAAVSQIINGLREIKSVGITYGDLHIGNIMKRGANYVLIDFGYSQSPAVDLEKI
jgi:serine/threonine protein kinase